MGNYNPHAPYVLGMEWVPIRQADYEPDQITEQGYTLALNVATAVVSGAFWAAAPPSKIVNYVAETVNIYPVGVEDQTGPIRRVLIPVSSVITTGASITNSGTAAWENPSDFFTQELATGVDVPAIGLNFAVENYTQELFGKRILGVRFLYTAGCSLNGIQQFVDFGIGNQVSMYTGDFNTFQSFVEAPVGPPAQAASALALVTDIKSVDLGNVNINLSAQLSSFGDSTALALPWRYQELLLFSTTTPLSSRRVLFIRANTFFDVDGLTGSVVFGYGALEVLYCEETRVRVGGRFTSLNTGRGFINEGVNLVALRDVNLNLPGTLPAGEYLVTLSHHEVKPTFVARAAPRLRRLRQLYELFSHRGVIVDSRVVEGAQFTSESTDEITAVTLHTSSSIVTGSHAYGTSVGAPVYGTKTPIQEVVNRGSTTVNVTQVRFYARRFGDTTVPLTFSATGGGFAVSISVADFDALPEIVDGWREVNLRLPAPSSQTAGGTSTWQWAASGEATGNQWQVLAASSPAGPRGSVPAVAATGPATYTPPLGTLLELNWQSPPISGTADDSTTDAVLLFSQEPPAVTGFAVSTTSVPVTGVGQFCGADPRCVPTAILGLSLTWAPFVTGGALTEGHLEIQRRDSLTDWQTVMYASRVNTASFIDVEARVGQLTEYRMRTLNALDFAGPWVTGSGTIAAPGVTVGGDGNSLLIFTSNQSITASLAYTMQFEGQPVEQFVFLEVDTLQLQRMFGKNFLTAFHPLERGGEQFTRVVLVNAAAVALPSLGNFRSLRDLGWASLNYVCVRDELGNRWFANVAVPEGTVRMNRTVYLAEVRVTEVTDTATPVDPGGAP